MKLFNFKKLKKSFTLIELLISVGIIGVTAAIAMIAINPAELFKQSRDSQRENDLNAIYLALQMANNQDLNMGICDGTKAYASLPSSAPLSNDNLPNGMSWVQVSDDNMRKTNGTGWIPINFSALGGMISLPSLPVDPKNNYGDNLFYTYTCNSSKQYVLTAWFESKHNNLCDLDSVSGKDGGLSPYLYEIGSNLSINPLKPIDFWALDEGAGGKINGSSGNNGELNNDPSWTSGRCGNAISVGCGGTIQSYVNIPDSNNILDGMSQLSVEAWAYPTGSNNSNFDTIVSKYHDQGNGISYYLKRDNAILTWAVKTDDITEINVPDIFYDNNWYYIVGTYDGSNMRIYVNGEQVGIVAKTGIVHDTTADIAIGRLVHSDVSNYANCNKNGVRGFVGKIEDVSIHNRALSSGEVYRQYKLSQY